LETTQLAVERVAAESGFGSAGVRTMLAHRGAPFLEIRGPA